MKKNPEFSMPERVADLPRKGENSVERKNSAERERIFPRVRTPAKVESCFYRRENLIDRGESYHQMNSY